MDDEGPNLDCVWISDLAEFIRKHAAGKNAEEVFPSHPPGYVQAVVLLVQYARIKAVAMKARMTGRINDALRHEHNCEVIYADLPDYARW